MRPIPYFDAHCDTASLCAADGRSLRRNAGHLDLERLQDYVNPTQIFALFADGGDFAECARQREALMAELAKNEDAAVLCRTAAEIRAAHETGRIAALLSVEGGELLDGDPASLATAAAWGVRCVNLTWNHGNALSGSHCDGPDRGLTDRGREFVREAERRGIWLDVSHLSDAGFWDLAAMASRPLIATHSNAWAVCPHSRNLTDDMFRAICDSGGFAGINLYVPFLGGDGLEDVARHIEHFLALGGEKHIGLGGDLDGCGRLPRGIAGVQDLPRLWDFLSARGYDEGLLTDLFYNNLFHFLEKSEKGLPSR